MTRDDWWNGYAYPLYDAVDASSDLPDGTPREKRLALLVEKCPWLLKELPGRISIEESADPIKDDEPAGDELEWTEVEGSSTIAAVTTIPRIVSNDALVAFLVRFRSGGTYRYEDVPGSVIAGFAMADSKGSYFARLIKDKYPTTKLPDAERAA